MIKCIVTFFLLWIMNSSGIILLLFSLDEYKLLGIEMIWFDIWIGIYYDTDKEIIYINPFPCLVYAFKKGEANNEN